MAIRLEPATRPVARIIVAAAMVLGGAFLGFQGTGLGTAANAATPAHAATPPSLATPASLTTPAGLTTQAIAATPAASATTHAAVDAAALPHDTPALSAGTYCQGAQPSEPAVGPKKVMLIELENESSTSISTSSIAPFENNTLDGQCGNFQTTAMHSTTHPSESNYFAEVSGLNAAIDSGNDALARFGLSDCPPDSKGTGCAYGGGHFDSSVPSLFSEVEQQYGTSGWKSYSDDMPTACDKSDGSIYATTPTTSYSKYVTRHNPAVFFNGIACSTQDIPAGDWRAGQGPFYNDLMSGNLPPFSFVQPNDIENGHDPVQVNGVTVAGGVTEVGNIDTYLSTVMPMIQSSPDYQSGNLVVMITFDEGTKSGPIVGEDTVGENCADPNLSVLATSCQVQTWIVGRYVPNYTYSTYMNQFGLLQATQRILNVSPILGHAADAAVPDIVDGTTAVPNPFNLAPTVGQTVPGQPTITTVTPANGSASIAFTPGFDGGSPVSSYQVTASPEGETAAGTSSPITVSGLTNGQAYTFTVTATNGLGTSPSSAPSNPVTPAAATTPGTPTGLGASGGNGQVQLVWTAPSSNGGSPITDYAIQFRPTGTTPWQAAPDPHSTTTSDTVSGLSNSTSYDFEVSAINGVGQGAPSTVAAATPVLVATELLPDPGFEAGTGGWKPFNVGVLTQVTSPVRSGSKALQVAATGSALTLVGLTQNTVIASTVAGTSYTSLCYVQPTSANLNVTIRWLEYPPGSSTATHLGVTSINKLPVGVWTLVSVSSAAVSSGDKLIPQIYSTNETTLTGNLIYDDCSVTAGGSQPPVLTAPSAPGSVSATAGDRSATVSFGAPASTGGAPITGYTVTAAPGGATATGAGSPLTVTGLTDGTAYTFTVTATNSVGTGPASPPSSSVTPAGVPSAPAAPATSPADGQITLTWTAPAANGSPITDYIVQYRQTSTDGWSTSADGVSTATSATVGGLTDATSYDFQIAAVNAVGVSSFSPINTGTPLAPAINVPGPPTGVTATAGDGTALVSFTAPASNGGSPITGYTATSNPGGFIATGGASPITVHGLTDGTAYTFTVVATNVAGNSAPSTPSAAITPSAQLLPDPGFELGNGGWVAFTAGNLTRVSSPIHGGLSALEVSAVSSSVSLVGLTQNSVIKQALTGATYTASCYVQPTGANLSLTLRFLEYPPGSSTATHLGVTTINKLTVGVWTQVSVSSVAVNGGDKLIPQIYSTNETTNTGSIVYDDCSVSAG